MAEAYCIIILRRLWKQEWWNTNRKKRITPMSSVWKKWNLLEDMGASEGKETTEATNNNCSITARNEATTQDSSDNICEDSTVELDDTQCEDGTLDKDYNCFLAKRKGDEDTDVIDNREISKCDDEMLQSENEGDLEQDEESIGGVETDSEQNHDKENSMAQNEENESKGERNSVDEDDGIKDDEIIVSDQNEDCSQNDTEQNCDIHEGYKITRSRSVTPQCHEINLELRTSEIEETISNDDNVFESSSDESIQDEGSDNEKKDDHNQMPYINRSVSEPKYEYLFNDPLEFLNSKLEEKEKRNTIVTDNEISSSSKNCSDVQDEVENKKLEQSKLEEEIPGSVCEQMNTRALLKGAKTYQLEKFEKNAFIIFNQEKIDGYEPRLGTRKDALNLKKTFGNYGFEIEEHVDFPRDDIFRELKKFSGKNFTDYGCVAVAILTHGSDMGELKAKDRIFYEKDVISYFRRRSTLVTKPKIIIIQACRGNKTTQAVHVLKRGKISTDHDENHSRHYTLPLEADTLVLHSTYEGNKSHRDETHGSWLIETLCKKINELASTEDLEAIITEVKREVATDKEHADFNLETHETDLNKQMPVVNSTLIRKLYLRKYEGHDVTTTNEESAFDNANVVDDSFCNSNFNSPVSQSGTDDVPTFEPCVCFLYRFQYLRDCINYFAQENPHDGMARELIDLANVVEEGPQFYAVKERVSNAIRKHLQIKAKELHYFKYLYLYKEAS